MMDFYTRPLDEQDHSLPLPLRIADSDADLYWRMALDMYREIRADGLAGRATVFIVPVGPVYQYRRFVELLDAMPLDLSDLHLFFMDEYLEETEEGAPVRSVPTDHPLSFEGFIRRELVDRLADDPESARKTGRHGFRPDQVHFPDPADPAAYDAAIDALGGPTVCYAGVGINGHLAFNEAPCADDSPSRIVELTPETITTNSHTALGGAYDAVPRRAVTVGMKSILAARRLSIWMNRPWQKVVVRKLLFGEVGARFPASFARNHGNADLNITALVAEAPQFALR